MKEELGFLGNWARGHTLSILVVKMMLLGLLGEREHGGALVCMGWAARVSGGRGQLVRDGDDLVLIWILPGGRERRGRRMLWLWLLKVLCTAFIRVHEVEAGV